MLTVVVCEMYLRIDGSTSAQPSTNQIIFFVLLISVLVVSLSSLQLLQNYWWLGTCAHCTYVHPIPGGSGLTLGSRARSSSSTYTSSPPSLAQFTGCKSSMCRPSTGRSVAPQFSLIVSKACYGVTVIILGDNNKVKW